MYIAHTLSFFFLQMFFIFICFIVAFFDCESFVTFFFTFQNKEKKQIKTTTIMRSISQWFNVIWIGMFQCCTRCITTYGIRTHSNDCEFNSAVCWNFWIMSISMTLIKINEITAVGESAFRTYKKDCNNTINIYDNKMIIFLVFLLFH